jgi:hypothetical protein
MLFVQNELPLPEVLNKKLESPYLLRDIRNSWPLGFIFVKCVAQAVLKRNRYLFIRREIAIAGKFFASAKCLNIFYKKWSMNRKAHFF